MRLVPTAQCRSIGNETGLPDILYQRDRDYRPKAISTNSLGTNRAEQVSELAGVLEEGITRAGRSAWPAEP
jgi:hypothetical protein